MSTECFTLSASKRKWCILITTTMPKYKIILNASTFKEVHLTGAGRAAGVAVVCVPGYAHRRLCLNCKHPRQCTVFKN